MPYVLPIPTGALTTNVSSLNQQVRSLQSRRSGISAVVGGPSFTTTAPVGTQITPPGWPSFEFTVPDTLNGITFMASCNVSGSTAGNNMALDLMINNQYTDNFDLTILGSAVTLQGCIAYPSLTAFEFGGYTNTFTVSLGIQIPGTSSPAAVLTNPALFAWVNS